MSDAATKADIAELLEVFRESNNRKIETIERKLAAVTENKWKREGNRRQFEFNQLSYDFLYCVFHV